MTRRPFLARAAKTAGSSLLALAGSTGFAATLSVQVTDAAGKALPDAVVYAMPAGGRPAPKAAPSALIDQVKREFVPLVSVMQTGTVVRFPNKDNIRHHVYSFSPAKPFELRLYSGTQAPPVTFDKPGLVTLGCNIHDNMIAYAYVVDTPYFAKSDANGRAVLDAVPGGDYEIHAAHYRQAAPAGAVQRFAVKDSGVNELALKIGLKPGN